MVVVHCAAAVPHWERYPDNEETASTTRGIDLSVVQAAEAWKARLIYVSTCGLYDPRDPSWKTEESPLIPRSPYFSAKLHGEVAVKKCDGIILRISAPYGPGMSPMLVLSRFIRETYAGSPLQVWGKGSREQDFIAAKDVAEAVLAAARVQDPGVFNVVAGIPITMAGLAGEVIRALGTGTMEFAGRVDPQEGWTARYSAVKAKERLRGYEETEPIFTIDNLPFTIGVYDVPINPQSFPSVLPLKLGVSLLSGLVSQLPSDDVRRFLKLAYSEGSLLGTAMDDTALGRPYAEDFLGFIRETTNLFGARFLEIGAGRGYLLKRLQDDGASVLGIEPGSNHGAAWNAYEVPVLNEFFPSTSITEQFDFISGYAVLEHIEELDDFLQAVRRQLKPGGTAAFAVPNCSEFIAQGDPSMLVHEHWHYFTAESLRVVMETAGFRVVHHRPAGYGSVLYVAATVSRDGNSPCGVQAEIERAREFAAKCSKLRRWAAHQVDRLAEQRRSFGVFVPGRALALLPPHCDVRFFDDDAQLHGRFFPPFSSPVEDRQSLLRKPVVERWILSRSFGAKLASDLVAAGELKRTRIRTIFEIAGEADNEVVG
jgi:dTDP-4-dehydrorhamnose reductase/SAM-dependent methyltransferase